MWHSLRCFHPLQQSWRPERRPLKRWIGRTQGASCPLNGNLWGGDEKNKWTCDQWLNRAGSVCLRESPPEEIKALSCHKLDSVNLHIYCRKSLLKRDYACLFFKWWNSVVLRLSPCLASGLKEELLNRTLILANSRSRILQATGWKLATLLGRFCF